MAKRTSKYVCQQCGYAQVGWAGKCPNCDAWNSLVETVDNPGTIAGKNRSGTDSRQPQRLGAIESTKVARISSGISELDLVLGGGFVSGQVMLLAGEPGIGKSTLLLQVANNLGRVFYASGEESATQVKIRADRLGIKNLDMLFMDETDVDNIIDSLSKSDGESSLSLVIIDSIQTMSTTDLSGLAGSVGQVRESAARLLQWGKRHNVPVILVGHVTKEGAVAGPAVLAHIVDSVLWFEGDKSLTLRMLRAVKNRFGPTDEVGIFTMQQEGLKPLDNAEGQFLSNLAGKVAGTVATSVNEGSRPILVEIQSLVVPTKLAFPKRVAQGIDGKRVELLLAVLTRRCGLPLLDYDVFVNVAGGITVREPSSDLAVCLSIASAYFDKPLPKELVAVGEVGLLGEIREVSRQDRRVKDAKKQGFKIVASHKEFQFVRDAIQAFLRK
jgi:DNA repair protein RadA/Sms